MFQQLRQDVLGQLAQLEETLATIDFKCDYYQQAVAAGTEASVNAKTHNSDNVHDYVFRFNFPKLTKRRKLRIILFKDVIK